MIAQGYEAGGHRGTFLAADRNRAVTSQIGTLALVPQIADAVSVPVIAAGGIADGRGIAAAFALGASGVQIGTGFLLCPEAATPALHRDAVRHAHEHETVVTNVFSGDRRGPRQSVGLRDRFPGRRCSGFPITPG